MIKNKKMIIRILFVLFFLCLVFSGGAFASENNIRETAYLEDSTGQLSVEQAQQSVFTAYSDILSKGYSESVFWVRLKIAPNLTGKPLVLRIQPTYLDDIEVYQRPHGAWIKKVVGDNHAFADREIHQTSFGVYIAPNDRESEIYVRLKTTSTHLIGFELLNQQEFLHLEGVRDLILSIFLGVNIVLVLWLFMQNSLQKDVLLLQLGLFLLVELIYLSCILGFVSRYILPNDPALANYLTSVFVIMIVFFGAPNNIVNIKFNLHYSNLQLSSILSLLF